jgi:hypothetical protein
VTPSAWRPELGDPNADVAIAMVTASLTVCRSQSSSPATSETVRPMPTWVVAHLAALVVSRQFLAAIRCSLRPRRYSGPFRATEAPRHEQSHQRPLAVDGEPDPECSLNRAGPSAGHDWSSGTVVAVSRTPDPWADVLADPRERARAEASRHPEVEAVVGLGVVHRASGFTGRVVGLRANVVTLQSKSGQVRMFFLLPGAFAAGGRVATLVRPRG